MPENNPNETGEFGQSFTIYLPNKKLWIKSKLEEFAVNDGRSVSNYVERILEQHIDAVENAKKAVSPAPKKKK